MAKLEFNHRTLPQGYQLGDYVIEDLLGQGGFGIAYLAKDMHLHNHVVIKEYFPNDIVSRDGQTVAPFGTTGQDDFERGMQRFVEEGRALARFNHPAVVRILKYFQQNNTAYLVMEFIDGEPLDQYLKRKGTLTPEVVEHLASELLDGLAVVHQHGLIHRDIKPANIMLRPGGKPVLIDFGAAKDALAEKSHSVMVTSGYGALEQYSSKSQLTPATDLYALGGTLYKCLTGKTPEEATARVIDDEHIPLRQLRIAKDCSPGLVELIDQCMEIKQVDRPQDAKEAKAFLVSIYSKNQNTNHQSSNLEQTESLDFPVSQNIHESSNNQREWEIALQYYPNLKNIELRLALFSDELAIHFRNELLDKKNFKQASQVAEKLENMFLQNKFGKQSKLVQLARYLYLSKKQQVISELTQTLSTLGEDVDYELVCKNLISKHMLNESDVYQEPIYFDDPIKNDLADANSWGGDRELTSFVRWLLRNEYYFAVKKLRDVNNQYGGGLSAQNKIEKIKREFCNPRFQGGSLQKILSGEEDFGAEDSSMPTFLWAFISLTILLFIYFEIT
ncbi:serine/threonine protein kinase [Thiomicrospira microaerophila]|uniref:serine/threonine protein kinase n=1 Tax=Thiomicrospira microaerophila TaxID=406020 RepID=UPI000698127B|nr:serine/threonine-protein kinase [Thiomicrospira microaerophila]